MYKAIGNFLGASNSVLSGGTVSGNLVVTGTLGVTGTSTLGAVNAGATTTTTLAPSGVTTLAAGTLAAPSLRFTGSDAGTGMSAQTADQVMFGRAGVETWRTLSGAFQVPAQLNMAAAALHQGAFRVDAETIKTDDYTVTSTDAIVIGNASSKTFTLPTTPGGDQLVWIKNIHATDLIVARNGQTIDGGTTNITLTTGQAALLYFEPSGWIRLGS